MLSLVFLLPLAFCISVADNGGIALHYALHGRYVSFPFSSESLGNLYGIDDMGSTTFFE